MIRASQREFDRRTASGEWGSPLQLGSRRWEVTERGTGDRLIIVIEGGAA